MFNNFTAMGRLVRDPELKKTQNGTSVTTFTIAVERSRGDHKTDFFNCTAWKSTAEFIGKYGTKGRMVLVNGTMQIKDWTGKDGGKRREAEVIAESAFLCDSKSGTSDVIENTDAPELELEDLGDDPLGELPF